MAKQTVKSPGSKRVNVTTNYRMFERSSENRKTTMVGRKKLIASLKTYGWLQSMPLSAIRNGSNQLIVKDGQNRLAIAEQLGISVPWVEETVDFNISDINSTAKIWRPIDHAERWAAGGKKQYQEGLEFAKQYDLSVGMAFALLGGTINYSNIQESFKRGTFKVRDHGWADRVAGIYTQMVALSPSLRKSQFLQACIAICRVDGFEERRLLECSNRCRDKLVSYSTRDAYLSMLEEVYNFGRKTMLGLKSAAIMAMRERSMATLNAQNKKQKAKKSRV